MNTWKDWFQVVDSTLLLAVLAAIWNSGKKLGKMETKIDTMWEWYKEHVKL